MSIRPPCLPDELDPFDDEWRGARRRPDGRLATTDPAERALRNPAPFQATGAYRQAILDHRRAAEDELDTIDRELAEVVARRRHLLRRIEGCNLALAGTGEIRDPVSGELLQRLRWRKRIPFTDEPPAYDERQARSVSGRRLAVAAVALLRATDQALSLVEIERLLRLQDLVPQGRPSQTISNALRPEVRGHRVERVRPGWYRAT